MKRKVFLISTIIAISFFAVGKVTDQIASSNIHASEVLGSTIFPEPVSRNTFMVFGNTYIQTSETKTSILASINKAVEDANIDFVIMVGELTISAAVDQFKAVKYVMDNSPVPVYVTASNHDLVYTYVDGKRSADDNYARFSEILESETEYTISKGGSYFIMQSHIDSNWNQLYQ